MTLKNLFELNIHVAAGAVMQKKKKIEKNGKNKNSNVGRCIFSGADWYFALKHGTLI